MADGATALPWRGRSVVVGPGPGIALLLICGGLVKGGVVVAGACDEALRRLDAAA